MGTVPQVHVRSVSLPATLSDHPINHTSFEAELQKLKLLQISSSEAIQCGFVGLANLYSSLHELTTTSSSQQSLILQHYHQDPKSIEKSLESSVEVLDCCTTIRELLQMVKANAQTLQSALRRKGLDSSIQSNVATYISFRKKMNKCISKTLKTLKNLEHKNGSCTNGNLISELIRDVRGVTTSILKSTLMFLSFPAAKNNVGWSLISKMIVAKSMASGRDHTGVASHEMGSADFAINAIQGRVFRNDDSKADFDVQLVQKKLQNLEACIEGIEGGLAKLFRQLVESRVVLLNILTNHH